MKSLTLMLLLVIGITAAAAMKDPEVLPIARQGYFFVVCAKFL